MDDKHEHVYVWCDECEEFVWAVIKRKPVYIAYCPTCRQRNTIDESKKKKPYILDMIMKFLLYDDIIPIEESGSSLLLLLFLVICSMICILFFI